ncbi:MAG: OmpA family protein [Candidatus Eisenbacteria bacterium]|nr:OmpA family protein [Candidatus Eisenbacteria bacterium]
MRRAVFLFTVVLLAMLVGSACAGPVQEHPLVRPFPGSILSPGGSYEDYSEYTFNVIDPETGKRVKKTVQGKYWKLTYGLKDATGRNADKTHSTLEYKENYKQAALEQGGEVLFDDGGYVTFTLPGEGGAGKTWVEVHIWNYSQQDIRIIEEKGFKKKLTFGPAEMKAALDADGRVQLYGILFDTDKATLKSESSEQLQDVVTLLRDNPSLRLEVQGHTDDQGSDGYNMDLSQHRAETVVSYLGLFGIDKGRLTPKGYGESSPVAPNTTDEGRAKNRRVELVKPDFAGAPVETGSSGKSGGGASSTGDLATAILGNWTMAPKGDIASGTMVFKADMTYEMDEKMADGSGSGIKGEYKLDAGASPARLAICLGKCDQPGSEWTTQFCILRLLDDGRLEIRSSPDSNYPSAFAGDASDEHTMLLKRA